MMTQWLVRQTFLMSFFVGFSVLADAQNLKSTPFDEANIGDEANVDSDKLWDPPSVSVCWQTPGYELEKTWVKQKIESEYNVKTPLKFTNWNTCGSQSSDIKIAIKDEPDQAPHCKGLGNSLRTKDEGIVLNFEFKQWGAKSCQSRKQACIEIIAVHEFGHAAGLGHEQNRYDTFGVNNNNECIKPGQGHTGNRDYGPWDPDSAMNYCNSVWANNGKLSLLDVEALNHYYGGVTHLADLGISGLPRAVVDVNGDAKKDYCRFLRSSTGQYRISCQLSDGKQFTTTTFESEPNITGLPQYPRYFVDVNGDGKADFCRFIGMKFKDRKLICILAGEKGFDSHGLPIFDTGPGTNAGERDYPRLMADVNRDKKADYCRFIRVGNALKLSCILAGEREFENDQYAFSSKVGVDPGIENMPRSLYDINRDGYRDYCRYLGEKPGIYLSCLLGGSKGFGEERALAPDPKAIYNKPDSNSSPIIE